MPDFLTLFNGAWDLIWHQSLGVILIAGFLAAAYFSPVFKKDFFYAAIIVGVFLVAEDIGIHDEHKKVVAQEKVINTDVDKAVQHSVTPKARKSKDPWNNKNY